ncbi:Gfo/Idh/MocA family protein [Actinocatenispora comari]|uniref:Oxidoreductase n=1 Tax=Actinocatenispora comari TaxID=2807577 RepID=A0A8J4A4R2_9ACTN|nr:Gfo/Idh/MocA family oxidoreductase [Actinocatenispora comari]GIL25046.1 oxidoreductase [Actinocatenispora comari]
MIRLALAGLGDIATHAHLPALLRSERVEVAALVDPLPERLAAAARLVPEAATHASLTPVLADPSLVAVVVATPPWVTTGLVRDALAAGKYVLAEKPLGTSVAEVEQLTTAPHERLQVGLTYRHDPALERLRDWITGGLLGSPLLIRAHIYDEPRAADGRYARRMLGTLEHGAPVVHEGAHLFDWLAYLLGGGPSEVADAWALATEPGLGAPNLGGARLRWPDGTTALTEFGWWTDALPRCEVSVLGADGYAVLDGFTFDLQLRTRDETRVARFPGDRTTRSFDRQLDAFADLVTGRRDTAVPGLDEGLAGLALSERIVAMAGGHE